MDEEADAIATRPSSAVRAAEDKRGVYDGNKPLGQIEEDIARTRVRLSAAIEALEEELAPHRVIENGAEVLRDALEPRSGSLGDQVRAYVIPLALIATGLGWLFALRTRNWRSRLDASPRETPAGAVETGETPAPAAASSNVVEPVEPVSLTGG
jgi:Protein of unknown function (DUF3618)